MTTIRKRLQLNMSDIFIINIFYKLWCRNDQKVSTYEIFHAFYNSMKIMLFKTHTSVLKQP